ncbi:hypothetical protein Cgig2_029604 [Carnegiea gigantea]|uniref:Uncharacterized protein n=1 Tax=Carnegiea gigantea TaxID=171969 RepID=A0A9Q1K3I8_9CARY|nr:hypothetical protein Cgig2_029604 [Carnegiea gigantea]
MCLSQRNLGDLHLRKLQNHTHRHLCRLWREAVNSLNRHRPYLQVLRGSLLMACPPEFILSDLTEDQFKENFDEDALKEEGNKLFKTKAYWSALNRYEKSIQYLCVVVLENENDAIVIDELAIAMKLNIAACWLKLKEFELNVNVIAKALVNIGLKEDARQDLLVALRFDLNNEEIKQELQRVEEMYNASNGTELVHEAEATENNIAKGTSKQVAQAVFDPLNLSDSSMFQTISYKIIRPEPSKPIENAGKVQHYDGKEICMEDTSSSQLEETKSHLAADNSSRRTRMRVGEFDQMEELSMGGCSSMGSNMDIDEQYINLELQVTDMSKRHDHDYPMLSASISTGIFVTRDVVYKHLGNPTRKCSLKPIKTLNKETSLSSLINIRVHRNDHWAQWSNILGSINQEHYTTNVFQFSAQQYNTHKRGRQCTRKTSRT